MQGAGCKVQDAVTVAAVAEMVHAASLIHDDVLDGARRRRGTTALHRVLGVKPAVILADFLFVRGLALLERVRARYLVPEVVREVMLMCEGQWLEIRTTRVREATEERYLEIAEKKTASLFAFCCRAGALLRRAPAAEAEALTRFGLNFGMAYQLLDDASDFEEGIPGVLHRQLVRWGGRGWLRLKASRYAQQARVALRTIPDARVRRGLDGMLAALGRELG
jgi:geranylgeranyl pyrophosphate synthase